MKATFVIGRNAGLNLPPRGRWHLSVSADDRKPLCGRMLDANWNIFGDRVVREAMQPESICGHCLNAEARAGEES